MCLLVVNGIGQSLARESRLAHVASPCYGITVHDGIVNDLHHLVHGYIIRQWVAPVILYLNGKGCIERTMGIAGDTYIVVPVKTKAGGESLWGIGLALISEALRTLT